MLRIHVKVVNCCPLTKSCAVVLMLTLLALCPTLPLFYLYCLLFDCLYCLLCCLPYCCLYCLLYRLSLSPLMQCVCLKDDSAEWEDGKNRKFKVSRFFRQFFLLQL